MERRDFLKALFAASVLAVGVPLSEAESPAWTRATSLISNDDPKSLESVLKYMVEAKGWKFIGWDRLQGTCSWELMVRKGDMMCASYWTLQDLGHANLSDVIPYKIRYMEMEFKHIERDKELIPNA